MQEVTDFLEKCSVCGDVVDSHDIVHCDECGKKLCPVCQHYVDDPHPEGDYFLLCSECKTQKPSGVGNVEENNK